MWVFEYWEDIRSDLRVFYRVDDPFELDGPTFFSWAFRASAYQGVMAARVAEEKEADGSLSSPFEGSPSGGGVPLEGSGARVVDSDSVTLQTDPALAGLFEKGGKRE